jgi:hypothetical protein
MLPGFQHQHAGLAVGAEPVGQHTAGGPAADHDVVVFIGCHLRPLWIRSPTVCGDAAEV